MKSTLDVEIITATDLRPGDLVLRVGLSGAEWCEVVDVETVRTREFPGEAIRVEFAGAPARRYVAGSTFSRRVETASDGMPSGAATGGAA